ncbi:MAG: hypothetical protein JO035_17555 [Betaproteobacteria bacterium]|nr:hypothetical protein [Betaproteobacteria bacterium]
MSTLAWVHCGRCHTARRFRFAPVVSGLSSLGTKAECASCSHVAFTMVDGRRAFCPLCDGFERIELVPSSVPGAGFACCSACGQLLAALYADLGSWSAARSPNGLRPEGSSQP